MLRYSEDAGLTVRRRVVAAASAVAAVAAIAVSAAPADAFVQTCSGPGNTGCLTSGYHSYQEVRSSKSGAAANEICVALFRSDISFYLSGVCGLNTTFFRSCSPHIPPQSNTGGMHWGSSNAWTVDGRSATASDANVCLA